MLMFALISVGTIWFQTQSNSMITWGVWFVFFVDFIYRFIKSENKWSFIRKNPFLMIAIIPLDSIFQLARITRLIHMFRLKVVTKHFTSPFIEKMKKAKIAYLIPLSLLLVFISVIPLYHLEPSVHSYTDAFLGSIASLVFFGSTTIDPETVMGNSILVILTVLGVMMHGVLISYLFTYISEISFIKQAINKFKSEQEKM